MKENVHKKTQSLIIFLFNKHKRDCGMNICEMIQRLYVRGMTEREIVDEISDDFGVTLSKETIRKTVNKVLKDAIDFNKRVIPNCPIVFLDGTHVPIKRKYDGTAKVEKECIMVALGITKEGEKVILGFYFTPNKGSWAWDDVLKDLKSRGLYSPSLFVTDGLQGMPKAIHRTFPKVKHQLCLVHETRTICRDVERAIEKSFLLSLKQCILQRIKQKRKVAFLFLKQNGRRLIQI